MRRSFQNKGETESVVPRKMSKSVSRAKVNNLTKYNDNFIHHCLKLNKTRKLITRRGLTYKTSKKVVIYL